MQNSRNKLGLFAVPFFVQIPQKNILTAHRRFTANGREALFLCKERRNYG